MYANYLTSKLFIFCLIYNLILKLYCFLRIDYCGISIMAISSFLPWLYYAFYCQVVTRIAYSVLITITASSCIVVSLFDKFCQPDFRAVRAGTLIF